MLMIAIATFFALTFMGALLTIGMMFHAYRDKIKAVIVAELGETSIQSPVPSPRYHTRVSKPYPATRRRAVRPVPLRAAA
jgi:hypothetical protein